MSEDMMIDLVVAKAELGSMTNRYNSAMEMVERLYDINEAMRIDYVDVNVAHLQADLLAAEAMIDYWREATRHMLQVKGSCGCQGRAEKLWCQRCRIMDRYEQETGNKCR